MSRAAVGRHGAGTPRASSFAASYGRASYIDVSPRDWTLALTGLAIYLLVVHSFRFPIGSVGIGLAVLGVLTSTTGLQLPAPVALIGGWLAWSVATGVAVSSYPDTVLQWSVDFAKILAIFFVVANATRSPKHLYLFIGTWLACFLAFPFRGQMVYMAIGQVIFGRIGWNYSFANYNDFAAYDFLILGLTGFVALSPVKPLYRKLSFATFGAGLLSLLLTQSRGAGLALVTALFFYVLRSRHRARIIGTFAALFLVILVAFPGRILNRITQVPIAASGRPASEEAAASTDQRQKVASVSFAIIRDHPFFGVGLGAYPREHALYAESRAEWKVARGERDAHNLYLLVAAETGIVGLLIFLAGVGATFLTALRAERQLRNHDRWGAERMRVLRFALLAYMLSAVFGSFMRMSYIYMYMAVIIGASATALSVSRGMASGSPAPLEAPSRRRLLQSRTRSFAARTYRRGVRNR